MSDLAAHASHMQAGRLRYKTDESLAAHGPHMQAGRLRYKAPAGYVAIIKSRIENSR